MFANGVPHLPSLVPILAWAMPLPMRTTPRSRSGCSNGSSQARRRRSDHGPVTAPTTTTAPMLKSMQGRARRIRPRSVHSYNEQRLHDSLGRLPLSVLRQSIARNSAFGTVYLTGELTRTGHAPRIVARNAAQPQRANQVWFRSSRTRDRSRFSVRNVFANCRCRRPIWNFGYPETGGQPNTVGHWYPHVLDFTNHLICRQRAIKVSEHSGESYCRKVTTHPYYQRHVRRERSEWPPAGCSPGSPWTADSLRFGNRLGRTCGCGSTPRLSA